MLNNVEGFSPEKYVEETVDRRGEKILKKDGSPLKYMRTDAKVLWFRMKYPRGVLKTEAIETEAQEYGTIVRFKASVYLDVNDPMPVSEWQHQETVWDIAEMDNAVSRVQTIALGKALSRAGFGCETELEIEAVSEGDIVEISEKPEKKRRGRPKKEVKPETDNVEGEIEALMKSLDTPEEPEAPKNPVEDEIEKAKETVIKCKETAPMNLKALEGKTIREVLAERPTFCSLVATRPNISQHLSDECVEAAKLIVA